MAPDVQPRADWTFDQAWAAQTEFTRAGGRVRGPFFEWFALQALEKLKSEFEGGDKRALLRALYHCAMDDITMPRWVADGYLRAYRLVTHYRCKTWDAAFGAAHPKNRRLSSLRRRRDLAPQVYIAVSGAKEAGKAIDRGLFESVGKKLHLSGSTAEQYYYWVKGSRKETQPRRNPKKTTRKRGNTGRA